MDEWMDGWMDGWRDGWMDDKSLNGLNRRSDLVGDTKFKKLRKGPGPNFQAIAPLPIWREVLN